MKGKVKQEPDPVKKDRLAKAAQWDYYQRKEWVMEKEKTNDRLVIVMLSDKNWWKIFGRSVLFYTKLVAPRLKKDVRVHRDDDFGTETKSKEGVVMVSNIEKFKAEVERLGLTIDKRSTEKVVLVQLNQKVTPDEINSMVEEEKAKWETAARMVAPRNIWTGINTCAYDQMTAARSATKKLPKALQETYGNPLMTKTQELVILHNRVAWNITAPGEALMEMLALQSDIDSYIMIGLRQQFLDTNKIFLLAEAARKMRNQISKEVKKEARREKKDAGTKREN